MNERIQELIKQAENYAAEQNDKFGVSYKKEYNQKFAELIVRECIYQVNKSNYSSGDEWTLWDEAMTCAANNIREHFGVEQ